MDVISASVIDPTSTVYLLEPIELPNPPYQELAAADKHKLWVVIYTHEPATVAWFDRLLANLIGQCGIPKHRLILHTSCLKDPDCDLPMIGSPVDYATEIINHLGTALRPMEITHHYVCLNRQQRWQRTWLVDNLKQQDLDRLGKISYVYYDTPMVLDDNQVSWQAQRNIDHPAIAGAAVNVITESAFEPQHLEIKPAQHYRPCITEKTFKSMYLCQLPVWVAPMSTVACYRDLGFDAFDDMINHAYDLQPDPLIRLQAILYEIARLTKISIPIWRRYRADNMDRFQRNLDRLLYFNNNHRIYLDRWNQIFQVDQKN